MVSVATKESLGGIREARMLDGDIETGPFGGAANQSFFRLNEMPHQRADNGLHAGRVGVVHVSESPFRNPGPASSVGRPNNVSTRV